MYADSFNDNNGWDWSSGGVTAQNNMGWSNVKIDNIYTDTRLNDAQFAILMMNNPTSDTTDLSLIERRVNELIAVGIMPILSTVPPRTNITYVDTVTKPYNSSVRALAKRLSLPLMDYYQEIVLRRPDGTWEDTLIGPDGVHPSGTVGDFKPISDPYLPGGDSSTHTTGDAALNSGYLLRSWLSVQKIKEIKQFVVDDVPPPDCGC